MKGNNSMTITQMSMIVRSHTSYRYGRLFLTGNNPGRCLYSIIHKYRKVSGSDNYPLNLFHFSDDTWKYCFGKLCQGRKRRVLVFSELKE